MRVAILVLCLAASAALPASAQESAFGAAVLGGVTAPLADARDAMGLGWNVGVAGSLEVTDRFGIRADYLYSRFGADEATFRVTLGPLLPAFVDVPVHAKSQMHVISLDATTSWRTAGGSGPYVMAGPSLFRRRVQLTADNGPEGQTTACQPQWLQCSPDAVNFDRALGIRERSDLGFNVGAGVAFKTGISALVVIEARLLYVHGPSFRSADGGSASASAYYVPVSVGLRF